MEREEILALVTRNLRKTVIDLKEEDIDPRRSMVEMGATSLDLVEVVSATMRALKLKVPRAALAELKCMNDLVDLLVRVKHETRVAVPPAA
jgi:polyketide biosynthesis acyl carrier protein